MTIKPLWKLTLLALGASVGLLRSEANPAGQVERALAHWAFDEGAGAIALDSSNNNHDGTIVGAGYVPGRWDRALSFTGAGQYVFVSDAQSGGVTGPGLDLGTRDWTVSVRVKTTAAGMLVTKMGFFGGANPNGWGVSISRNGTVGAHLRKSGVAKSTFSVATEKRSTMGSGITLRSYSIVPAIWSAMWTVHPAAPSTAFPPLADSPLTMPTKCGWAPGMNRGTSFFSGPDR